MNSAPTPNTSDAIRTRRLLILGVVLILAAAAIMGGRIIHSRMQQASLTQDRPKDLQYGINVYSPATLGEVQTKREKYVEKANMLRDHWRTWAVAHQDMLRQLRQASPNDNATLMRVYSALPSAADPSAGVTMADIGINQADFNAGRGILFGWQAGGLSPQVSEALLRGDPKAQDWNDRANVSLRGKLHRDFAKYHSIMLSESIAAGRSRVTLWADGRITEMTRQNQHVVGKPTYIDGPEKELVPAYDFLK